MFKLPTIFTLLTLLLASTILALPALTSTENTLSKRSFGPYVVSNYISSCSNATCTYSFNVTYTTATSNLTTAISEPSFSTYCSGSDTQSVLRTCSDGTVWASKNLAPANGTVSVQHSWVAKGARYVVMASGATGVGHKSFSLPTTKIWSVSR